MQIKVSNKDIFPGEVQKLLQALHSAGFLEESMLIGSWVMPLYKEAFGIQYALRTQDIDFAVGFVDSGSDKKVDLEKIIMDLGYLPVRMQSGIHKYTHENLTVEFIVHRRGGRSENVVSIRKWNITAYPLPFVDILLNSPFIADFGDYNVRAPLPEAFFVQKLITSQRRPGGNKKDKDLEQCSIIAPQLDSKRLSNVLDSVIFSKKIMNALRASCVAIDFPPQNLGLE